jgi:L-ascorbate metabolism protein UlaG (beta-lactamase superfamily)
VIAVTWLGHSSVVLDIAGRRLLTDPLLRRHAGILRRRSPHPSEEQWVGSDAVLLSHLHHDHADLRSLRSLGEVPILTGRRNAEWLGRRGLAGVALEGWRDLGGVEVRLVPAVHHSRRMPHRPNDAHGHLVRAPDVTVWVAGDTSLHDDIRRLGSVVGRERVDVVIVPIGGWGPRLSPGHLGPEEAAQACSWTQARHAVPVHWGTFHVPPTGHFGGWMERPAGEFATALRDVAPTCHLVALEQGDTWTWRPGDSGPGVILPGSTPRAGPRRW